MDRRPSDEWTGERIPRGTEARRPNIIVILPDQQRFDSLGCYGNRKAISPHIDRLADEGACFESAFVTQPVCSPARSSILTGLFPHKTEVWDNDVTLTDHTTAFPRLLHEMGYTTGYVGKWHLGPKPDPFNRPVTGRPVHPPPDYFDVWQGHDGGASQWVGEPMDRWTVPENHESAIPDFGGEEPGMYRADLVPTVLDLCGLDIPAGLHGHSAKELLLSGRGPWRDSVYIQNHPFRRDGRYCATGTEAAMFERCIVTAEWKLIVNSERPPELYHRPCDPDEKNNRYGEPGLEGIRQELFEKLEEWAWQTGDGMALSKWLLYKWK